MLLDKVQACLRQASGFPERDDVNVTGHEAAATRPIITAPTRAGKQAKSGSVDRGTGAWPAFTAKAGRRCGTAAVPGTGIKRKGWPSHG